LWPITTAAWVSATEQPRLSGPIRLPGASRGAGRRATCSHAEVEVRSWRCLGTTRMKAPPRYRHAAPLHDWAARRRGLSPPRGASPRPSTHRCYTYPVRGSR
jgi:hypothetical protein